MSSKKIFTYKYFKVNGNVEKPFLLIFRQNVTNSDYFKDYNEFLDTNTPDKYSILGILDDSFKSRKDSFEFILEYPETSKYGHWLQKINPLNASENEDIGFDEIQITWEKESSFSFIGLHQSSRPEKCFIEGTKGTNNDGAVLYFFAIGMKESWNLNKLPGYDSDRDNSQLHEVCLWVQVPNSKIMKLMSIYNTCNIELSYSPRVLISTLFFNIFFVNTI